MKKRRQHEKKMAQLELDKLKNGRLNKTNVKRYAGAAVRNAPA